MQIKVTSEFPDVLVSMDVSTFGKQGYRSNGLCYDSVILHSSVKVHVFKWPVREAGICIGIASVKL